MSNLDNDHVYQEEMDNLYMRHMMHRYMQYCGEKLLEEEMSLLDTTERHPTKAQYRRMKRDLQRIARKSNSHAIRVPRRFVPQVVILIALLAVSLIVAGAYKINAFGFLSAQTPQYTEYGSRTIGRACSFSYIPDGLTERSYEVSADAVRIIYTDNENINRYFQLFITKDCNSVQREHDKKLNNGLPILHMIPPYRDYGRYFCIQAGKGGTIRPGLIKYQTHFLYPKQEVLCTWQMIRT